MNKVRSETKTKTNKRARKKYHNKDNQTDNIFSYDWVRVGSDGETEPLTNLKRISFNIKIQDKARKLSNYALSDTPKEKKHKLRLTLNILLTNMIACLYRGNKLVYSRDTGKAFVRVFNRERHKITSRQLIESVALLERFGLVSNNVGESNEDIEKRSISYLLPTKKFKSAVEADLSVIIDSFESQLETTEVIVLRDHNKQEVDLTQLTAKDYKELNTTKDAVQEMWDLVIELNKINSQYLVLDGGLRRLCNDYCRIFNKTFLHGGRFYRADVVSLSKQDGQSRLDCTINNEMVAEIDFATLHFRIALALAGKDLNECPVDIYSDLVENFALFREPTKSFTTDHRADRTAIKVAINIMFNCDSRAKALRAYNNYIQKMTRNEKVHYTLGSAKLVFKVIEETYGDFVQFFYRKDGFGLRLQNEDSHLANDILKKFISLNKPCLPIHDSFLVRFSDMDLLAESMAQCFRDRYNSTCGVPLSITYIEVDDDGAHRYIQSTGFF